MAGQSSCGPRPTARGHTAVEEARRTAAEIERDWTGLMGRELMTQLRDLLERLHDAVKPPA
jgi:hypothetical protein